jgi:hypothetical protein
VSGFPFALDTRMLCHGCDFVKVCVQFFSLLLASSALSCWACSFSIHISDLVEQDTLKRLSGFVAPSLPICPGMWGLWAISQDWLLGGGCPVHGVSALWW